MNVSLSPNFEKFINEKIQSGLYNSASEVVREGLRLMMEKDSLLHHRLQQLNEEIDQGLEQLAKGQGLEGEQVFKALYKRKKQQQDSNRSS